MAIQSVTVIIVNTVNDPAGIWKLEEMCLSIVLAWSVAKVCWFKLSRIMIPVEHIGVILSSAFSDSTWPMLQSFHGFDAVPSGFKSSSGFSIMHALLRNLQT